METGSLGSTLCKESFRSMRKQNTSILELLLTVQNLNVEYVYYSSTGKTTKKDLGYKCVDVDVDSSAFPEYACAKRLFINVRKNITIDVNYKTNNSWKSAF